MTCILALESSCDETSAAIVTDGRKILANSIYTQIATHRDYGGVVPEIASREHLRKISAVVEDAFATAGLTMAEIDAVAVTQGPGLVGSLLVGLSYGKAVALALDVPLIAVNHLAGHLYGAVMTAEKLTFPAVGLIASGGHSSLVRIDEPLTFALLGETRDDAAGEVLDKVSRAMGLPYPGGAELERLAATGNREAVAFPRAWLDEGSFDFSFSGLKSHALNYLNRAAMRGEAIDRPDMAASFQEAVFDVLSAKAVAACVQSGAGDLLLCGGVSANGRLRQLLKERAEQVGVRFHVPPAVLCTDNAAMIGAAAYELYRRGRVSTLDLNAEAVLPLDK